MSSQNYAPRHGAARHARKRSGLVAAVRRPVVGGAIAVAMLGSVGATVAIGDPSHSSDQTTAAMGAPAADASATATESTQADMARLAESRRVTNVSRSASREQDRLSAIERKDKAAAAKKAEAKRKAAAKKKAADKKKAAEKAKPMSQREFTDDQIKQIQADPAPYGKELAGEYGWGEGEWSCLVSLWIGESNWQWDATNSSSGAYGIPQSLPATKMATAGPDWKTNPVTQMEWGMDYIKASYGTPCGAKSFWDSKSPHWY
ncbi:MAG: hypothetical protein L0G89_07615 [Janibacter sp.]|nr:hypothetical protein [Janibacter sp.]